MKTREPESLHLCGDHVCLHFTNTANRPEPRPYDELGDYASLISWGEGVKVIGARRARALRRAARARPAQAQRALARARELREAIYRTFAAQARDEPVVSEDLASLSAAWTAGAGRARLAASPAGIVWSFEAAEDDLDQLLGPVARSAAELLTSPGCGRVRECASETCSDLFLDSSKNHRRRWCDMKVCGNRAKARRHRERQRA